MDGAQTCLPRYFYWLDDGHEETPSSGMCDSSGTGYHKAGDPPAGQLSRLTGTKPQLPSPTAGSNLAPSRKFGWRRPEGPAAGTIVVLWPGGPDLFCFAENTLK